MLDYKIKDLKKQIEPRENEIKEMKEQIGEVRILPDSPRRSCRPHCICYTNVTDCPFYSGMAYVCEEPVIYKHHHFLSAVCPQVDISFQVQNVKVQTKTLVDFLLFRPQAKID